MSTTTDSAEELVADLRALGVQLSVDAGMLRYSAPRGALKPAIMMRMRTHKAAILSLLESESPVDKDVEVVVPVSIGQEALWSLDKQFPGSHAYNAAGTMRFVSSVDPDALQRSFRKLVARHEPLRTTFHSVRSGVEAVVHSSEILDFRQICVAEVTGEDDLLRRVRAEYEQPFDLEQGPLVRVRLFTRSDEEHVLLICVHHIVFDAWSLWLLLDELRKLYASEVDGSDCMLPRLPSLFSDFVRWQLAFPNSSDGDKQWIYWKQQLDGDPVPAELLWDHARPRHARDGVTLHFPIDTELASGLRELARRAAATPFAAGLAVFQTLMFRMNPQEDSIVGITTSGRSKSEFADVIGYFVNTLPIRGRFSPGLSFAAVLDQTKRTMVDAIENQDFPFAEIVHRVQPLRDLNAPPLCRVIFGLQKPTAGQDVSMLLSGESDATQWGPARVSPYKMDQQDGQFDLVLELYETPEGYAGVLKYDRNLMSDASAQRFAGRYVHLLRQVVADPSREVQSYSVLLDSERQQILDWSVNDATDLLETEPAQSTSLKELFENQVDRSPKAEAIVFDDQRMTYGELDSLSNLVARWLRREGAGVNDHVVVATRRCIETPVLMLACAKIGVAYVPMSPTTPEARACQIISGCNPVMVVAEPDLIGALSKSDDAGVRYVNTSDVLTAAQVDDASRLDTVVSGETTAYIICTSGSTGTPKGIAVSNLSICRHVRSICCEYGTTGDDRMYQFSDFTFDPSIEQMLVPWSVGGAVVFRGDGLPSVSAFWKCLKDQRVTMANLPPKYFEECSYAMPVGAEWPKSLKLMIVGGDVFPAGVTSRWWEQDVRLLNAYGPTESVITATTFEVEKEASSQRQPIGRPKPGSTAYVLDCNTNNLAGAQGPRGLLPIGVAGELCLGGPMLADGYVNLPELTAQQFVDIEIAGHRERVYRTGDLARWNCDGYLEFLGRIDRQVKIRGFRIELGDIEAALLSHDAITGAVVKALENEGDSFLAAFLTTETGKSVTVDEVIAYLKGAVPAYMVPARIILLDEFPLFSSGKIDPNKLVADPPSTAAVQREYVAPRNEIEQIMADVWADVLELNRVGVMDDFYELGGGSLQSLRIVSQLQDGGIALSGAESGKLEPQLLFQFTTISELSSHLTLNGR